MEMIILKALSREGFPGGGGVCVRLRQRDVHAEHFGSFARQTRLGSVPCSCWALGWPVRQETGGILMKQNEGDVSQPGDSHQPKSCWAAGYKTS